MFLFTGENGFCENHFLTKASSPLIQWSVWCTQPCGLRSAVQEEHGYLGMRISHMCPVCLFLEAGSPLWKICSLLWSSAAVAGASEARAEMVAKKQAEGQPHRM